MRLMFCASGAVGHVLPMTALSTALSDGGHEIAWATSKSMFSYLQRDRITLLSVVNDIAEYRAKVMASAPKLATQSQREWSEQELAPKLFGLIAMECCDALRAAVETWKPDALIYETGAMAAPIVAKLLGLPSIHHGFGIRRSSDRKARFAAAIAPIWRRHGLAPPESDTPGNSAFIDLTPPGIAADAATTASEVFPMRPIHIARQPNEQRGTATSTEYEAGRKRPRVYLSFGTVQHKNPALFRTARALAALPIALYVTNTDSRLRAEIAALGEHVVVHGFLDQSNLLTQADYVVSHAGSGTCLGALAYGRPQLCLPQGADQFFNADAIVAAGAGLSLDTHEQTDTLITQAMLRLFNESKFQTAAHRLATAISKMPSAHEVARQTVSYFASASV